MDNQINILKQSKIIKNQSKNKTNISKLAAYNHMINIESELHKYKIQLEEEKSKIKMFESENQELNNDLKNVQKKLRLAKEAIHVFEKEKIR